MTLQLRPGEPGDLSRLVEIYNHYVSETHVTFDTEPFAVGARTQWFTQFAESGPYRLLVAELDGAVIGYASSTRFQPKPAYGTSVETTVYIDHAHTGKGYGAPLYAQLLQQLVDEQSVHRAYGGVALPNPRSVALHQKLGFAHVASYHEVGYKFGKYWDVDWFEKDVSK
ncbi:MAG: GNAT family N-acetyltransferase [Gammaproteobacteria bacterium]|nr:GNAT family N-acetyltransferase [Gammaproteobacteria bacterium]MDH3433442.1 GNAT family N-acetyltransferase [Gammaproteobacteria bacterium]